MLRNDPFPLQKGFSILEVLIAIAILAVGLLGLAGLQARAITAEAESLERARAILLVQDMVGRIESNRAAAKADPEIYADPGVPELGVGISCTTSATLAERDRCEWSDSLKGAAAGGSTTGSGTLSSARGCVTWNASATAPEITVTVAWLGRSTSSPSAFTCGNSLITDATKRRVVSQVIRLATLG